MSDKKQTAVEWLAEELKKGVFNNDVSFYDLIDKAKELEKRQKDNFAIEFAEWLRVRYFGEGDCWAKWSSLSDNEYTTKELLEIFKKERGL